MANKSQALCWNPMEPINLVVGCDDSNCYMFDMRKLETIKYIYKDHISAIMDVDFSPTGREFVSGSYDKTIRIFQIDQGKSKEVFHTKRMQQVFAVQYTMDSQYILSGSDDMNIRIWKSKPAQPVGVVSKR
jgi:WD repeat and SOF domain-containing protein 1